jgi:phenylacetate-CoA ligase
MYLIHVIKGILASKKNLKLTKNQIKELQLNKFRQLVEYIYDKSPFYREIIDTNKIDIKKCCPEDFPILEKQTIIDNFDRIVTDPRITKKNITNFLSQSNNPKDLFLNEFFVIHTSGSSGQIGLYIFNKEEMATIIVNSSRSASLKFGQKLAYIAAVNGHFAGITMASQSRKIPLIYKDFLPLDINTPFSDIIKSLNDFQPTNLSGYAFAIAKLAQAQKEGKLNIKPLNIQVGGEPLFNEDKRLIEEVFKVKVVNVYASSELLFIGVGKEEFKDNMMLMDDCIYTEIFPTHSLMTSLFGRILPLIRYKMNDRLELAPDLETKNLPYQFTYVKNLVGRNEMIPYFINESGEKDFIHFQLINEIYVPKLDKFQMFLTGPTTFTLRICLEKNIDESDKKIVKSEIRRQLELILSQKKMNNVVFDIIEVDTLWADPKTGKFKLIVNNS